jgi:hypothetical protein
MIATREKCTVPHQLNLDLSEINWVGFTSLRIFLGYLGSFRTMPASYCLFELSYFRDMQPQRKVQSNDMNDLMSLCLAIPYCDVVVTERQWANAASQRGIERSTRRLS